jgi:hypothetical protein
VESRTISRDSDNDNEDDCSWQVQTATSRWKEVDYLPCQRVGKLSALGLFVMRCVAPASSKSSTLAQINCARLL